MRKILMVLRREYLQSVQKKSFWIGTLALPLLFVLLFALPIGLNAINPDQQKQVVLLDRTGKLLEVTRETLADRELQDGTPEFVITALPVGRDLGETRREQEKRVLAGELFAVITVGDDVDAEGNFNIYLKNVGDVGAIKALESALNQAVIDYTVKSQQLALEADMIRRLTSRIDLKSYQVTESGESVEKGFLEAYLATYMFVFLLYIMIYFYGFAMTRGVLQEKSNRVMEVLLGSLTPDQLMTGKILGIGLVGLTQVAIYMATVGAARFIAMTRFPGETMGEVKVDTLVDAVSPMKLVYMVVFFVFGYFIFSSLFAIVGAACSTEQEAQNLQMPVLACLMIPLISTIFFVKHPDAPAAVVLSMVPIFTPMLMFMRISVLTPPFWQIGLSILLMVAMIWVLMKAAAKVFRIGTLMHGKRPTIPEILRWARS